MHRRNFLAAGGIAGTALAGGAVADPANPSEGVFIERAASGQPHAGKVLAAIQPHCDDIPLFAGGLVFKLLREGYTGYLIRTTNDDMTGPGSIAEGALANDRDHHALVRAMGFKKGFSLNYRNHQMDGVSKPELRSRLIFLFRLLKVDTIICYDPWGHYEENPDHYVTAECVESACWMAAMGKDYPEHMEAGLHPHGVREKYYFARGPQLVNRVVDITPVLDQKIDAMIVNQAQGPAGSNGARLRASLAGRNLRLPLLGANDQTANREYIRRFLLTREQETGKPYGLTYAEPYHYIGPPSSPIEDFVKQHAIRL
jgi:LmbE family N-acetylglucosaminyl deacetylase